MTTVLVIGVFGEVREGHDDVDLGTDVLNRLRDELGDFVLHFTAAIKPQNLAKGFSGDALPLAKGGGGDEFKSIVVGGGLGLRGQLRDQLNA